MKSADIDKIKWCYLIFFPLSFIQALYFDIEIKYWVFLVIVISCFLITNTILDIHKTLIEAKEK